MTLLIQYTLIYASVLLLVALGGCFSEHSGVINLGLEGIMVMGAMGGALVMKILADGAVKADFAVIDGGITPYQLPKPVTYLIAVRDFLMFTSGKYMSIKMLSSVFDPEKYSKEDLMYVKKVMRGMSARTVWRGFYSTNNYSMPPFPVRTDTHIEYWYGEDEKKARAWDIEYVRKMFPGAVFREKKGMDHAEYFILHPQEFAEEIAGLGEGETGGDRGLTPVSLSPPTKEGI